MNMSFRSISTLLILAALIAVPRMASAHFVWVVAGEHSPDGKVHVYFGESTSPDDPDLLDRLASLKVWHVSGDQRPDLPVTKGEDSLVAEPGKTTSAIWGTSYSYGVIERGGAKFLLKYHAKCLTSRDPQEWKQTAGVEALPLEIVPRIDGDKTVVQVLWQGKPAAGDEVTVSFAESDDLKGGSNEQGEFSFSLADGVLASIRARHVEQTKGEQDGKSYDSVRHYATLTLALGADTKLVKSSPKTGNKKSTPSADENPSGLPLLDPPVTSFGAAIVGSDLYVCAGHLGGAHEYSDAEQSDQFRKLNLAQPKHWEVVGSVPKRTGFPLVVHGGKVYRIGGFEARNHEGEEQNLVSTPDFARFDPQTKQWEELTPMPAGRSSHDAVVIGDQLYVFGGWELNGPNNSTWHDNGLVANLAAEPITWKEISVPFRRRAISVGEWQGKVAVIGGMQEEGGITRVTSFFDPSKEEWTEGPEIAGEKMDGFGSSAFLCGGKLYVSTYSGKVQRLADDGSRWDVVGELAHPRFFHRMLPTEDGRLLVVGGASMESGKIQMLEFVAPK